MTNLVATEPIRKVIGQHDQTTASGRLLVDTLVAFLRVSGLEKSACDRAFEFFTVQIPNENTRAAYCRAVRDFFAWVRVADIGELVDIEPVHIATYLEQIGKEKSAPTVKQNRGDSLAV